MSKECDRLNAAINPEIRTSDVFRFNNSMGELIDGNENVLGQIDKRVKVEVGRYCYELVLKSIEYYSETEYAFSITVDGLMKKWSVDAHSLEKIDRGEATGPFPTEEEILIETQGVQNPFLIEPLVENGKYYLVKDSIDTKIDLGGIAKGYLADRLAAIATERGVKAALIDVGGTLRLIGLKPKSESWKVGVREPEKNSIDYLCALNLPSGTAVATSGSYERGYYENGLLVCHIINPQSGLPITVERDMLGAFVPSTTYVQSATVWGASAETCDVLSTASCVLGASVAPIIKANGYNAVLFTVDGYMYVIGSADFIAGFNGYEAYERVNL